MRTVQRETPQIVGYKVIRLLVLDLIHMMGVVRRPTLFRCLFNLPAATSQMKIKVSPDLLQEVLKDLMEENLVRELQIDMGTPLQFLLTEEGIEEWGRQRADLDMSILGLRAVAMLCTKSAV